MRRLGFGLAVATALAGIGVLAAGQHQSVAQSSSLFHRDVPLRGDAPVTLAQGSWYYRQLPPPKEIRINDIVKIRVDEKSQMLAEGDMERRKTALYNAVLKDWIGLEGLRAIRPDPQTEGDPHIQGQLNQLFRAEAEMETRESMTFDIAATVVDIRPNGNLVLEAHKVIRNNDETWEYSLAGICRREDITPGNVLLSHNIAEISIRKGERGHVRDGYKRGWFWKWFDLLDPF